MTTDVQLIGCLLPKEKGVEKKVSNVQWKLNAFRELVCEIRCECVAESRESEQLHVAHVFFHD